MAKKQKTFSFFSTNDLTKFITFNKKIYPDRKNIDKHLKWILNNPSCDSKMSINVCKDKKGNFVGQFFATPFEWIYNGKIAKGYWGADFYVDSNWRGQGVGLELAKRTIQGFTPYFVKGITEKAKRITEYLGAKTVGQSKTFFCPTSIKAPFYYIKHRFFKSTTSRLKDIKDKYPVSISAGSDFKRIDEPPKENKWLWKNTLYVSRSKSFLKWRFFERYNKYGFYGTKQSYFVVRTKYWMGLKVLVIVDYRFPQKSPDLWKNIIDASKILAKTLGCDGILTTSTHSLIDKGLKSRKFIPISNSLVMTTQKFSSISKKVQNRSFIFVTMADADSDLDLDYKYT